jgi:adenosylcobinamide-phosphate guanylyltransferase
MRAIIMAGGCGTRLNLGEKPLVSINGIPMVLYIISAFQKSGHEVVIVTSPSTPYTYNWARAQGYECIRASGNGYIEDLHEAVEILEEKSPFFICVADIPCLTRQHIRTIQSTYERSGKEALSVWVRAPCRKGHGTHDYLECIGGIDACPAGINILRGDLIDRPQEELQLLIDDPTLTYNVNTRKDLEKVRLFLSQPTYKV